MTDAVGADKYTSVQRVIDGFSSQSASRGWGNAPTRKHTVQFYLDDTHLTESVGRFVASAFAAGDAVVVVATAEHVAAVDHYLSRALGDQAGSEDAFDVEHARLEGRYLCLDAPTTLALLLRDGNPDPNRFKEVIGATVARALAAANSAEPRVAVYGELVALLSAEGNHGGALALERMWNELIATHPISLHCGYPIRSFSRIDDADAIRAICECHTAVVPAESYPAAENDDARHRATALLQQRSEALDQESAGRQRAEATLQERDSALRSALATRDQFLMAAAHELKTPVTSLRVYAQLLQRDLARKQEVEPDRLGMALQAIERQTAQLAQLVGQLVDVAQLETETFSLQVDEHDLVALVRSTLEGQPFATTHRLVVEGPETPSDGIAQIDAERMGQVVTILAGNAAKFSPAGSAIVFRVDRIPESIRFSVTDSGAGIAPEQREQIFERFHQAHEGRHGNGLGLGLYVARQIVVRHGGTIRVEEPDHPGARFVIDLPVPA